MLDDIKLSDVNIPPESIFILPIGPGATSGPEIDPDKEFELFALELLSSFTIRLTRVPSPYKSSLLEKKHYANHSVLSSGNWFRIKVNTDGIYQLSYEKMRSMGIVNPENVRLYGNGGGMLSLMNKDPRPDDLLENAIYRDNESGYILFYGESPHVWKYDGQKGFFNKYLAF